MRGGNSLDSTFAALSDPTRRAVIDLLVARPRRAGELADALAISPPALSRHLRVLRKTGLIVRHEPEDDARVRLYRLQPEGFVSLRDWLAAIVSFWRDQLQAFKAQVERAPVRKTPGGNARKRAITTPMRPRR